MELHFSKLQGSGNDFVIVDNRSNDFFNFIKSIPIKHAVKAICSRRTGIGADGLILIENSKKAEFKWRFFNQDGSTATMCGNGARCVARFAFETGITGKNLSFETESGIVKCNVNKNTVKVTIPWKLKKPQEVNIEGKTGYFIKVGVPHLIIIAENVDKVDVIREGKKLRYSEKLQPHGANINFVERKDRNILKIRTYERGVEAETLSCGTGSVASSIVISTLFDISPPFEILTGTGERITVDFKISQNFINDIKLEGKVVWVYDGILRREVVE